jgi:cyclic pyranopterin phosphate synthase
MTGLRKELVDSFGRFHSYLRMSLTEKCNLRCQYCMPENGVQLTPKDKLLSLDERKRVISLFVGMGVNKLRFTGGEPTVSNHLLPLIQHTKSLSPNGNIKSIGITSNGILLADQLPRLVSAGLSSVNISLDTLIDKKFAEITRRDAKLINRVQSSIFSAQAMNLPVKINCVMMKGINDDELYSFLRYAMDHNLTVRFIELMPFNGNQWDIKHFMSYREILERLEKNHVMIFAFFICIAFF